MELLCNTSNEHSLEIRAQGDKIMQTLLNNNLTRTEFSVQTEWEQGFTGRIDIVNQGEIVEDWLIEFESAFEIEPGMIWGAEIISREGTRYTLQAVDYNQRLDSQQTATITFNANKVNGTIMSPSNIVFTSEANALVRSQTVDRAESISDTDNIDQATPQMINSSSILDISTPTMANRTLDGVEEDLDADIEFTLINDWGSGFQGQISITNNSNGNIDSWDLEFDFPNQIDNIWDAEIEERMDGGYVISHTNWNREIAAGETLTFGFTGSDSVTSEPQNFTLDGSLFNSASRSESIYTFSNPDLSAELELNQEYQGRATFYDAANPAGGLGASGYDVPIQSQLYKIVAINNVQWNGSEASGAFFEVSGPKQRDGEAPIIVQVVDYLYERADGFDMSAEAFRQVADPIDGIVNIEYELVGPADDYVTAYGYSIGQGIVVEGIDHTNPYYGAVRLNNHRYPIESVDLITDEGDLVPLERESDNRFVFPGNYPLYGGQDLIVTDIFDQQVTLNNIDITNGSDADIITGEQFAIV